MEATRQQAHRVTVFDHEAIMEEAERRDRLEYEDDDEAESDESSDESGSEVEIDDE